MAVLRGTREGLLRWDAERSVVAAEHRIPVDLGRELFARRFQIGDAGDIVHLDIRRKRGLQAIEGALRKVTRDQLGLLFPGRVEQGVQDPGQPIGNQTRVRLPDETAGAERDHGSLAGLVAGAVVERLDTRLVNGISGHANPAIDELAETGAGMGQGSK